MSASDTPRDRLLVVRCQLGEAEALAALHARFDERLARYLRGALGDAGEDARQDVWFQILRSLAKAQDLDQLDAWVFGIARRVVIDTLRRKYRRRRGRVTPPLPHDRPPPDPDELDGLRTALGRLSFEEREAVTLFHLLGRSAAVVAAVQGVPEPTVRSRLLRARRRMASQLPDEREDERS